MARAASRARALGGRTPPRASVPAVRLPPRSVHSIPLRLERARFRSLATCDTPERRASKASENEKARLLGCSTHTVFSARASSLPRGALTPRMPVTSQEHLVRMGSGRQMDDDGVKPQVDILAMLDAASSQSASIASAATKAPRMSAPPGFDKPDAKHPHKGDKDTRVSKKERGASRSPGAVERPGQVPAKSPRRLRPRPPSLRDGRDRVRDRARR
jgi:hypothetical protein